MPGVERVIVFRTCPENHLCSCMTSLMWQRQHILMKCQSCCIVAGSDPSVIPMTSQQFSPIAIWQLQTLLFAQLDW